ncbi:septum formation initiator family protein [Patescibacteria group bacterium]|nr:septum formation initiator family protein [Patescibacteria group bacterium]
MVSQPSGKLKANIVLEFREKRKLKQILYSKLTLAVLFIIVLFLASTVLSVYQKEKSTRVAKELQEMEFDELSGREAVLRAEIDRLNSNRGIEEEIRSKFEVGREGERIIIITNPVDTTETENRNKTRGFLGKVLDIFTRD